ncbi:transthyretin-like family domain-containing protein [Ditylenchus destructor]|nr:transthyretin-like family domain-containing protein [Ditylenchus destructor]
MKIRLILILLSVQALQHSLGLLSDETIQRRNALTPQELLEESNSKYPKRLPENPQALPGPQYSSIDWHVHVIAHLKCNGSPVSGQLVELQKNKPNDIVLDGKDTNGKGMVDLVGHHDEDDGIEAYVSIKHTRHSCVYCTSKFKVPQNHACKGPCLEDKLWGIGIELTAYECHCNEPL